MQNNERTQVKYRIKGRDIILLSDFVKGTIALPKEYYPTTFTGKVWNEPS